MAESYL